jgi:nicotinamide mononucleotide (NMN) deamidase PncC
MVFTGVLGKNGKGEDSRPGAIHLGCFGLPQTRIATEMRFVLLPFPALHAAA